MIMLCRISEKDLGSCYIRPHIDKKNLDVLRSETLFMSSLRYFAAFSFFPCQFFNSAKWMRYFVAYRKLKCQSLYHMLLIQKNIYPYLMYTAPIQFQALQKGFFGAIGTSETSVPDFMYRSTVLLDNQ